jgi:transcriptional regulator with XRE-family HTH domain
MAKQIEPFYEALGAKIQEWRGARKMTQAQLGLVLKPPSTRASIANIENGKQRVLVHTLVQLAKALEVEIHALLPPVQEAARSVTPKDVELELRRKLNLATPQLRKLVGAARPAAAGSGEKA